MVYAAIDHLYAEGLPRQGSAGVFCLAAGARPRLRSPTARRWAAVKA